MLCYLRFSLISCCGEQKSWCLGCEGDPSLWEAGRRVCCRASQIFSCLWRFPILQLRPCQYLPAAKGRCAYSSPVLLAAGLPTAAPKWCQAGCPLAWPRECEGSIFTEILQGTHQAFKMFAACCPAGCLTVRVCDPYCRIALRQSAAGLAWL